MMKRILLVLSFVGIILGACLAPNINSDFKKIEISKAYANTPGTFQPLFLGGLTCSGGTVSSANGKTVHTFTTSSSLICQGFGPLQYLATSGGGTGGCGRAGVGNGGGGGGAGGALTGTATILANTTFVVTIGAKGIACSIGAFGTTAASGSNTTITNLGIATLVGGGGGANDDGSGAAGGSTGGGSNSKPAGSPATAGQGNLGAAGPVSAGGGGGGQNAAAAASLGGAGLTSFISGVSVQYAAGAGGGTFSITGASPGTPGSGGGGSQTAGTGQGVQGQDGIAIFAY